MNKENYVELLKSEIETTCSMLLGFCLDYETSDDIKVLFHERIYELEKLIEKEKLENFKQLSEKLILAESIMKELSDENTYRIAENSPVLIDTIHEFLEGVQ